MIRFLPVIAASEEILELSDKIEDDNPVKVQRARLQVDSRKWLAARMAPKKYGDRINHDVKGDTNVNFQPQILIQCSSGEYEQLYATPEAAWPRAAGQRRHCTGGSNRGAGQSHPGDGPLLSGSDIPAPADRRCAAGAA